MEEWVTRVAIGMTALVVVVIAVSYIAIFMMLPMPQCPEGCDDMNPCTVDFCGPEEHLCVHNPIPNCCGNGICEIGEVDVCGDCPNCEDGNRCTLDWFDYETQACQHTVRQPPVIFEDSFNSAEQWINATGFELTTEGRNNVTRLSVSRVYTERGVVLDLVMTTPKKAYEIKENNYSLGMRMKLKAGSAVIDFRKTPASAYRLKINLTENKFTLTKMIPQRKVLLRAFDSIVKDAWIDIKIAAVGNEMFVLLGGKHFFSYKDEDEPLLSGSFGLGVLRDGDWGEVLFDDVVVKTVDLSDYEC